MNRRLTPILVFGKNVPSGLLTSTTTRRIGLVSSVDFAPTLLAQLSIPIPAEVTGRVMQIDTSVNDRLGLLALA
jgi:arylsulfatase A-like enzyme